MDTTGRSASSIVGPAQKRPGCPFNGTRASSLHLKRGPGRPPPCMVFPCWERLKICKPSRLHGEPYGQSLVEYDHFSIKTSLKYSSQFTVNLVPQTPTSHRRHHGVCPRIPCHVSRLPISPSEVVGLPQGEATQLIRLMHQLIFIDIYR